MPSTSPHSGNVEMKGYSISEIQFPNLSCAHRVRASGEVSVSVGGRQAQQSLVSVVGRPAVRSWELGSSINFGKGFQEQIAETQP